MTATQIKTPDPDDPAVRALISALDRYLAGLYPAESNHGLSLAALQADDVRLVVAELDGRLVGCAALRLDAAYGEVKRMFVLPEARGAGIGRTLLAHLEDLALAYGLRCIRLETGVVQPEALGLYEASGYLQIPPFPPYRPDPLSVFMEKALGGGVPARTKLPVDLTGALP